MLAQSEQTQPAFDQHCHCEAAEDCHVASLLTMTEVVRVAPSDLAEQLRKPVGGVSDISPTGFFVLPLSYHTFAPLNRDSLDKILNKFIN